jgi:hypothetical protein
MSGQHKSHVKSGLKPSASKALVFPVLCMTDTRCAISGYSSMVSKSYNTGSCTWNISESIYFYVYYVQQNLYNGPQQLKILNSPVGHDENSVPKNPQ